MLGVVRGIGRDERLRKEGRKGKGESKGEGKKAGRVETEQYSLKNSSCSVSTYPGKLRFIGNQIHGLTAYYKFTYNSGLKSTFPPVTMLQGMA